MKILSLMGLSLVVGVLFISQAIAVPLHKKGCDYPLEGVQLCWEATGPEGEEHGPFPKVHLLPIAWERNGDSQVLADYSRSVFRQLLPGDLAEHLIPEWTPVYHLEEALSQARINHWPITLWIAPRVLRTSSSASEGVVDWDVYAIKGGRLLRTLRIRVSSQPKGGTRGVETGVTLGSVLMAVGAFTSHPLGSGAAVAGAVAMAPSRPRESGISLEMMTELAVRKILSSFQYPMEEIPSTQMAPSQTEQRLASWIDQVFAPK